MTGFYAPNEKYPSQLYRIRYEKQFGNKLWGHTMTLHDTSMFGQIETAGELDIDAFNEALKTKKIIKLRPLKYKKHHKLLADALMVKWRGSQRMEDWYNIYKAKEENK